MGANSAAGPAPKSRLPPRVAGGPAGGGEDEGAVVVVVFLYMQILGTAGCNQQPCPRQGPGEFGFTIIQYGAPVVAVAALLLATALIACLVPGRRAMLIDPAVALRTE